MGFTFDGIDKTLWLEEPKREALLATLQKWIRAASSRTAGIPFEEFRSVIAKLRHAFTSIPAGKGLLSPCNRVIRKEPKFIYLHRNQPLLQVLKDMRTLLRESTMSPTKCLELVSGWPDFVGVKDASGHGVGGVIIGENEACPPTVFRMEWPDDIKAEINSSQNRNGRLTNSDLEMAGLLLLFLVMEEVCTLRSGSHIALFSDNQPTVSWVERLAAKSSAVAGQLVRALALRLKKKGVSPLTMLHIAGEENAMTDIPSRSFGSAKKWHFKSDSDLLQYFNKNFPLPNQASWTVFRPSSAVCTKILSVLRMQDTSMDAWRRLPKAGRHIGDIGAAMSSLWEWTLTYRTPSSTSKSGASRDLPDSAELATTVEVNKSKVVRSLARSRPLARRSPWCIN